jgi:glycosyltransferase involved in cell wall biosynthesis
VRRVLLVTYYHAPMPFLGGDPWSGLASHLRKLGHELTVLTTRAHGSLPTDPDLGIVRTPDLVSIGALRRALRRPEIAREGQAPDVAKRPPAILTRVVVPDAYLLSWGVWAIPTVRRLIRRHRIECVITTSPPDSTHLVGLGLGLGRGGDRPAWIADFRDGWMFDGLRDPFPTAPQRRLDGWLEAQVAQRADRLIAHSAPLIEDFASRFGRDGAVVPNAWDPDLEDEVARATPPALDGTRVNLVYTGTLGGVSVHEDRGLIEALRRLVREEPDTARRFRLVVAGRLLGDEARVLQAPDLAAVVDVAGALPRPAAIALQRRADALLLVSSHLKSHATGKLFEYLTADRPILALAGDNEAARIVRETGTGEVVAPDDVDAILAGLRRVANRSLTFAPRDLERYTYTAAARQLAEEIEVAIARHDAG